MKKPLIALMPLWDEKKNSYWMLPGYMDLIIKSGGVPVMLAFGDDEQSIKEIAERFDGFLFTGGDDIDPARYGQPPHEKLGSVTPERDVFELLLAEETLRQRKPIFAICRGCQLMNVALGGTLWQDLPSQQPSELSHVQKEGAFEHSHSVSILPDTPLADILGKEQLTINSFHHQAAHKLGEGLQVMAHADDGVVEAMYLPEHPFLWALQWHPERLCDIDADARSIFRCFVEASQ